MQNEIRRLRGIVREAEECFTLLRWAYDRDPATLYDVVDQVLKQWEDA
jgi:hypothetical protein